MGGQPTDAPRDLKGVHEGLTDQDRTVNVPGAHGSGKPEQDSGGSSNEVMGVGGDNAVDIDPSTPKGKTV